MNIEVELGQNTHWFYLFIPLFLIIAFISHYNSKASRIKRKLKRLQSTPIRQFKHGAEGKIIGPVEAVEDYLIAPLSKRKCIFYQIEVEQENNSENSSTWRTIINDEVFCNFMIKQGNDYAIIDTTRVHTYLVKDARFESGFLNDAKEHLERYLRLKGKKSTGFLGFNKTLRYKEGIIEPGEEVAVRGIGYWFNGKEQNLPSKFKKVLVMKSSKTEPLYVSDLPSTLTS